MRIYNFRTKYYKSQRRENIKEFIFTVLGFIAICGIGAAIAVLVMAMPWPN